MSKEKILNLLKPHIGDPAVLVMDKLVHLAKDCEFTIEMAKLLEFEYIDLDKEGLNELPIFAYRFINTGDLYPTFYIYYQTYDHHNNPREISILTNLGNGWTLDENVAKWSSTKYYNETIKEENRFDELLEILQT